MIRPIAICVIRKGDEILVFEARDNKETFYRPLGGGINFGEHSKDTVAREMLEEIGAQISPPQYLGTLETIFVRNGVPGHQLVQVYEASLVDALSDGGLYRPRGGRHDAPCNVEEPQRLSQRRCHPVPGRFAGSSRLATRWPERPGAGRRQRGEPDQDRRTKKSTANDVGRRKHQEDATFDGEDPFPHGSSAVRVRCSSSAPSYSSSDWNSSASRSTRLVAVSQSRGSVLSTGNPRRRR